MTTWTKEQQAQHRKLWVEALRSGKYQQARGQLRFPNAEQFCCLGVACEISGLGAWECGSYTIDGEHVGSMYLPTQLQKWLGVEGDNPKVTIGRSTEFIGNLNDEGKSFEELAAIIESEPKGFLA